MAQDAIDLMLGEYTFEDATYRISKDNKLSPDARVALIEFTHEKMIAKIQDAN